MNSIYEKVWFKELLYFNICRFRFSKFQITIAKNNFEKSFFFIISFEISDEVLLRHKYF